MQRVHHLLPPLPLRLLQSAADKLVDSSVALAAVCVVHVYEIPIAASPCECHRRHYRCCTVVVVADDVDVVAGGGGAGLAACRSRYIHAYLQL